MMRECFVRFCEGLLGQSRGSILPKYSLLFFIILYTTNMFAYDQEVYKKLLAGGKKFENVDLSNAKIEHINLSYVTFINVNLSGSSFDSAELADVTFINVNLSNSHFDSAVLANVTFDSCDLSKITFYDVKFQSSKILNHSNLSWARLSKIIFNNSEIIDSDLSYARLLVVDFTYSILRNIDMNYIHGNNLNFSACSLEYINFSAAQLESIKIYNTNQIGIGIIFEMTHLSKCYFLGKKEERSLFKDSNFYGMSILDCYFVNLNFDGCTNLDTISWAERSLFDNISSVNPKDLEIWSKKLKEAGAKVNGDWLTIKEYWSQFDTNYCEDLIGFFWQKIAWALV